MPVVVIGHLQVVLGCRACYARCAILVAVLWDQATNRPVMDEDDSDVHLWREGHRLPYAVAP